MNIKLGWDFFGLTERHYPSQTIAYAVVAGWSTFHRHSRMRRIQRFRLSSTQMTGTMRKMTSDKSQKTNQNMVFVRKEWSERQAFGLIPFNLVQAQSTTLSTQWGTTSQGSHKIEATLGWFRINAATAGQRLLCTLSSGGYGESREIFGRRVASWWYGRPLVLFSRGSIINVNK